MTDLTIEEQIHRRRLWDLLHNEVATRGTHGPNDYLIDFIGSWLGEVGLFPEKEYLLGDTTPREALPCPFYDELDPGIRDIVKDMCEQGFVTTDSGDGYSKPDMECALPFPHVFVRSTLAQMQTDAVDLQSRYPEARVEASWAPNEPVVIMVAWDEEQGRDDYVLMSPDEDPRFAVRSTNITLSETQDDSTS